MTPSDETIRAYLALPIEARRALAEKAEGPGWAVGEHPSDGVVADVPDTLNGQIGSWLPAAWIPASEAETLRVWGLAADRWYLLDVNDECDISSGRHIGTEGAPVVHTGTYDSRLRAAAECCPSGVW